MPGDLELAAKLLAYESERAIPIAACRQIAIQRDALVFCPIAMAGMHHAVSFYETLAANAATYALVGLIVETFRRRLHLAH